MQQTQVPPRTLRPSGTQSKPSVDSSSRASGDGDIYAPYWDRWAAEELQFIDRDRPQSVADYLYIDDGERPPIWRDNSLLH